MKRLLLLWFLSGVAGAANLTVVDPNCTGWTIAADVVTCTGTTPPIPPTPPSGDINCATSALGPPVTGNTQVIQYVWGSHAAPTTSGFGPNDSVVVQFTAGTVQSTNLGTITIISGPQNPDYRAYLSQNACDFRLPPVLGWQAVAGGWTPTIWFTVGIDDHTDPVLVPGRVYYYSIKIGPAGCTGGNCNGHIDFREPSGG